MSPRGQNHLYANHWSRSFNLFSTVELSFQIILYRSPKGEMHSSGNALGLSICQQLHPMPRNSYPKMPRLLTTSLCFCMPRSTGWLGSAFLGSTSSRKLSSLVFRLKTGFRSAPATFTLTDVSSWQPISSNATGRADHTSIFTASSYIRSANVLVSSEQD